MRKIAEDSKIKASHRKAIERSFLNNPQPENASQSSDTDLLVEEAAEFRYKDVLNLGHLTGHYERYRCDPGKNYLFKDILTIERDGRAVIQSVNDLYSGHATYLHNAILQINIATQNMKTCVAMNMMMFVGGHDREMIRCLHALCLTTNADNQPAAQYEVVMPVMHQESTPMPERIKIDSLEYFKLRYRFPELIRTLQQRPVSVPSRVDW